ncbi:glycosyltransferase [Glaciimonas sp. PAMC28666]|uniref:glycosyltransferase n=1 Tax=Glaciimonas sp. PAMC28666 TaxID=2807626 RepID=UPI001962C1F3|nr:glycosyltransferase [Glaciimonas sp. PAMC28666]QRX84565.1 glycosyltransferase [Glaciimonas sp. PAMC28666]
MQEQKRTGTFILYAPNVHTGGGFVLLSALLAAWPRSVTLTVFLDRRAHDRLEPPTDATVFWVDANMRSRLRAELDLRKSAVVDSTVLCFHGLPPLMPISGRVILFQQNRILLGLNSLKQFSWKTGLRLSTERIVSRIFRYRVSQYIVQTPSMKQAVTHWCGALFPRIITEVKVLPFIDSLPVFPLDKRPSPVWDFVYAADGEAHKNHRILLMAWQLLAQEGLYPTLALTLGARDSELTRHIEIAAIEGKLNITNLGQRRRDEVLAIYASASAMIFPSTSESFGLPLVEAANLSLPILAAELDFVRDVCVPVQTFDPLSPVSIARAVKRFLGEPESTLRLRTPSEWWAELLPES